MRLCVCGGDCVYSDRPAVSPAKTAQPSPAVGLPCRCSGGETQLLASSPAAAQLQPDAAQLGDVPFVRVGYCSLTTEKIYPRRLYQSGLLTQDF